MTNTMFSLKKKLKNLVKAYIEATDSEIFKSYIYPIYEWKMMKN